MARLPMVVLRVLTLGPALLVSFVLTVVVCVLLPSGLGLTLFATAAGVLVALASGGLEGPAIVVLTGSRRASPSEARAMAPVVAELERRGVEIGSVWVRRVQHPGTPVAVAVGPRAVLVTPGLVRATYREEVSVVEAAAVLGHAVGRRRAIRPRLEIAVLAATTPWRMVMASFRGVGQVFAWLPLARVAWTLRGVVGVVCVVQSVADGRPWPGLLGGTVVALTYLVPAAGRGIQVREELVADRLVVDIGLGGVLSGLLRRYGHPMRLERLQRLEEAPALGLQWAPLHLVPD